MAGVRSRSMTGMTGRCPRCHTKTTHCVCAAIPTLMTRTEIVVIRHFREDYRSTGTARIAGLALPNLRFVSYGHAAEPARSELPALLTAGACALFPNEPTSPWPEQLTQLVVLDGTWRETRRMYHRLDALHPLPRLSLPPKDEAVMRLRAPTFEGGRSTLEAIADALGRLEGPHIAEALLAVHALYVERTLRTRGEWERRLREHEATE